MMTTRRQLALQFAALGSLPFWTDLPAHAATGGAVATLPLDGRWDAGYDRKYDRELTVPGLAGDPAKPAAGTLWYRRRLTLPDGVGSYATLTLKGARFAPEVYVDGSRVSSAEGGMAATHHRFKIPGRTITLEIALKSLNDLDSSDASYVPMADQWRNNVSSGLWDSVILRLHGGGEIVSLRPTSLLAEDQVSVDWHLGDTVPPDSRLRLSLIDGQGKTVIDSDWEKVSAQRGQTRLRLKDRVQPWSPETPNLYLLRAQLRSGARLIDQREQTFGLRDFRVAGLGFTLNGQPSPIRMGTVVWHRWTRDPEAARIAFDTGWFEANVVRRLKAMGANALRFHLGLPPETLLDLCDRHGLMVQMEWPFFHGIGASEPSMQTQWHEWLETAARHPSVVVIQPWNETGGEQLKPAMRAIEALRPDFPPQVMNHAEVTPIHKYWWSLFENLGLYYDSAAQFGRPVMVDEFGGNYLDGKGDPGGYPTTGEAFLRFLGRNNSREERLHLHAESNARVAEYWRRLGVAGFSPFTILGSHEDGNHWFMGQTDTPNPEPKPVWKALAAAFAARSVSLEIWNRNFAPGETLSLPLWFFNDMPTDTVMQAHIHVVDRATGKDVIAPVLAATLQKAHSSASVAVTVIMPAREGEWRIEARLSAPVSQTPDPVVSAWDIRTLTPRPSPRLMDTVIAVADTETELRRMLQDLGLRVAAPNDPKARLIAGSQATWQAIQHGPLRETLNTRLMKGTAIVLLDAGPQPLGVGYASGQALGGPLEGAPSVANPARLQAVKLFGGVDVEFFETAEPESALQPAEGTAELWQGLAKSATWLWNGLRGGLIVPAAEMRVNGLSGDAILSLWKARGADVADIRSGAYFAYELAGYYAFSSRKDDKAIADGLRKRVKFLVEDAPALVGVINPNAPVTVTDLHALFISGQANGQARSLTALANAGKNLTRTPVIKLTFGEGRGNLILSQLLTRQRLLAGKSYPGPGVYGLRYDPACVQMVLNMLDSALTQGET